MSEEQNIKDFLDLLKGSVTATEESTADKNKVSYASEELISEDILKEQLRSRYFDNDSSVKVEDTYVGEYAIDNDFLNDVEVMDDQMSTSVEEDTISEDKEASADREVVLEDVAEVLHTKESEETVAVEEPVVEALSVDDLVEDLAEDSDIDYTFARENEAILKELLEEKISDDDDSFARGLEEEINQMLGSDEVSALENEQVFDNIETVEASVIDELDEPVVAPEADKELLRVEEIDEFEHFDDKLQAEEEQTSENTQEPHETFIASMRKIGVDFANDRGDSLSTEDNTEQTIEDDLNEDLRDEELDYSTINLMMQFCEKEELDKTIGDQKVEKYLQHEQSQVTDEHITSAAFEGEEYSAQTQNDRIMEKYKKERNVSFIKLCGCALLAIIAIVFEIAPMLGAKVEGLLDYTRCPSVYVLFGLQFVIFSAAICYKQLWMGLKRAFSTSPSKDSIVAVVLSLTALYDLIIAIILAVTDTEALPALFNGLAVVTLTLSAAADFIRILAEMRAFGVYSSDDQKYTLVKESKQGAIASKMYFGGVPMENNVYTIKYVDFPRGFFKCVGKERGSEKIITTALIPVLALGLIATIVSIVLGSGAYEACVLFLLTVYAILPITYIYSGNIPNAIAALRLAKRGSAIAGDKMIDRYNDCDVVVFEDIHMFRKCKTEEIGIAIYDTRFAYLTLGCVDAVYTKIGGPLSGMQMQLPDVFKFTEVSFRRITRTGIEAVVDKKHVVILGDIDFMKRYGLVFPEDEKQSSRSTLCVSINGAVSAKLSVKYEVEPIFEMLVERLQSEGIVCAIETYDPLINSEIIRKSRNLGTSPVSVIHMNADDFVANKASSFRAELDGMIACNSRLKLAEIEVWIKRQAKVNKILKAVSIAFSVIGALLIALVIAFGLVGAINQFYVFGFLLAQLASATAIMLWKFPKKNYFTTDALYREYEKRKK